MQNLRALDPNTMIMNTNIEGIFLEAATWIRWLCALLGKGGRGNGVMGKRKYPDAVLGKVLR